MSGGGAGPQGAASAVAELWVSRSEARGVLPGQGPILRVSALAVDSLPLSHEKGLSTAVPTSL